jgi:outer membrane receptor protein involved in Fe transport
LQVVAVRQFLRKVATGAVGALVAALLHTTAVAQDEDLSALQSDEVTVDEIVVTGSRLRRRDFNAPSPIASVDQEQLRNSGQPTIEAALNQMPQVIPGNTRSTNNGNSGIAEVNLRGFGSKRTLVMMNGRRLSPSGIGTAVDINNIPQVLIDRVEIITGGATTVYGSDAVSGVVNFITRTDFDGFGLDASAYVTGEGDSDTYDINLAYGHNFANGRGNVSFFAGYLDREELLAGERKLTEVAWDDRWWNPALAGELVEGGNPVVPDGAVFFPEFDYGNGSAQTIFNADGSPREYIRPDDLYNYAPINYIQTPLERHTAGVFFNYDLSDRVNLYAEGSYTKNQNVLQLAPTPAQGLFEFNTDNPLMTPETQQIFAGGVPVGPNRVLAAIGRRFVELGPRRIAYEKEYLRLVTGITGDLGSDWEYDAWVTYTESDEPTLEINDASRSRFQQSLLVDPATGQCFDPSGGCVPLNWFGAGNISAESIDFIRVDPLESDLSREQILVSGYVRGRLFDTWDGPVETAFGAEWRRDDGSFISDPAYLNFDTLAFRGDSPVVGAEEVYEFFGEMLFPLAESRPFADYLAVEIGGRVSDYQYAGDSTTWKAGLDWRPFSGLRLRGMVQRSVRAPNLEEAFREQGFETFAYANQPDDDPCSAVRDPQGAGIADKCIATGLPADQIGVFNASPQPADFVFGGNPDLEPEEADTLTVGFVIAPDAWSNFQLAVDYFDLQLDGGIGPLAAESACFDSANTGAVFCDRISRDPLTFNVIEVLETNINRGELRTTGFDTQVNASFELPSAFAIGDSFADLDLNIVWTHVLENSSQETSFGTPLDCAGYFSWPCSGEGLGSSFPADRLMTNLSYASGDFVARLTWAWIDSMKNAAPLRSADFGVPDPDLAVPAVGSKSYLDLGLAYRFSENIEARMTIANLTDTEAPIMGGFAGDLNTDAGLYDIYGRAYTLTLSLNY